MKKNITLFFTILSCLLLNLSFGFYFSINSFDPNLVKQNIDYLSSDKFKGRLSGTLENDEAALYIRDHFEKYDLSPYNGSYFQSFNTVYPHRLDEKPYLRITDDNGFIVKDYKYAVDFKEDLVNFKENKVSFNKKSAYSILNSYLHVYKDNNYFLFYVPDDNKLIFRSSFINSNPISMYVMVTQNTLKEIRSYVDNNFNVNCYIPLESKQTSLNNVIGIIEGKNKDKPPIILSAHFDHVGTDLAGNVYNGALDNASGISFILEMSRYIKSLGKPDRDIIFAGFNAEEFGCLGSKAFVEKYFNNIKGSKVFNFDMIGGSYSNPIYIMGAKSDSAKTNLIHEVSSICSNDKINFDYLFEDASDHEFFRKKNIDAVTLSDCDTSKIHTIYDKSNFIDKNSINRCFNIINKEVVHYAFSDNLFILYYRQIFYISIVSTFLLSKVLIKIN